MISVGLNYVGLSNNTINVGVIGLSQSGKTSLIQLLSNQTIIFKSFVQPQHLTRLVYPAFVEIIFNNKTFRLYELGYYMYMKPGLCTNKEEFFKNMDALIYMIDITDNFNESKKYFAEMLTMNKKTSKVPILVLGNKIDRFTREPQDIWNKYQLGAIFGIYSNQIIKDIVFGFIERNSNSKSNHTSYLIPFEIKQLCYKYYIGYIYNGYHDRNNDIMRLCRTDSFRDIQIELLMCSVMKRIGLKESLEWLINVCNN